jgi:cytidyltransferase-like protein
MLVLGERMKRTTVIYGLITGGFDPLHGGHMDYILDASRHCDHLWVGLNSDKWLIRKKGYAFMQETERRHILSNLRLIDNVVSFNDDDDTACGAISNLLEYCKLIQQDDFLIRFMNGGDRILENTPELMKFRHNKQVEFLWGIGGSYKRNSSSELVKAVREVSPANRVVRNWGYYEVLDENKTDNLHVKIKKLVVNPGASLSMQMHYDRHELWFVAENGGILDRCRIDGAESLREGGMVQIPKSQWHRLANHTDKPLIIYEIQYGTRCEEEDIVRK